MTHDPHSTIAFKDTSLTLHFIDGVPWLAAADLSRALGYARADKVSQIYRRNAEEFTDAMTLNLKLRSDDFGNGVAEKDTRLFSARGAHLIAMLAHTDRAKAFRRWVLDVLDQMTADAITAEQITADQLPPDAIPFDPRLSIRRGQRVLVRGTGAVEDAYLWTDYHPGEDLLSRARIMSRDAEILALLPGRNLDDEATQILRKAHPDRDPEPEYQGVPVPEWRKRR